MDDPLADTQPSMPRDTLADYQPVLIASLTGFPPRQKAAPWRMGCGCWMTWLLLIGLLGLYVLLPLQTNLILFGVDDRTPGRALGRSDTLILVTVKPLKRYIGMLSIPRDLWVQIPGHGENRINTAHFFGEAAQTGSGPAALKTVIQVNFGVDVQYYVRIRFDNFIQLVDAVGGVEIALEKPTSGYPAGAHRLDGKQALAFVRDRAGADDFARMRKAQLFLRSLAASLLAPGNIIRLPNILPILLTSVETDIPVYLLPKFGFALLLTGVEGMDTRVIEREMVTPFTTSEGAQVLGPRWELISPLIEEMFDK